VGAILAEDHPAIHLEPMLEFVLQNAEVVSAPSLPEKVCGDPDDDKFLACALASGSKIVVSGDKHLLKVSGYQEVEVLRPREFLDKYL
jgi:predicted nucleic acid-binding protein